MNLYSLTIQFDAPLRISGQATFLARGSSLHAAKNRAITKFRRLNPAATITSISLNLPDDAPTVHPTLGLRYTR